MASLTLAHYLTGRQSMGECRRREGPLPEETTLESADGSPAVAVRVRFLR